MERVEENAIVLDFLSSGKATDRSPFKKEPIAQVIGTNFYTLLEVVPKKDEKGEYKQLAQQEEVYIGKEERDKIHFIKKRIKYNELTSLASSELEPIVRKLVEKQEKRFVDFFNNAQSISTRQHQLELLPKIGKKLMWEILEEREKEPFKDFDDIKNRIRSIPSPRDIIVERILEEIKGDTKYYLFTAHPPREQHRF